MPKRPRDGAAADPPANQSVASVRAGHDDERDDEARRPAGPAASEKAAKRAKLLASQRLPGGIAAIVTPAAVPAHPFAADPHDHAETPFEAYQDVEPVLFRLASLLGRSKASVKLYDPFYCAGSVKRHLARLGFDSVRNDNVDFYGAPTPQFDVLVSNPPFSGDHMPRTVAFAVASGKPWLLLMPDFVAQKAWFRAAVGLSGRDEGGGGGAGRAGAAMGRHGDAAAKSAHVSGAASAAAFGAALPAPPSAVGGAAAALPPVLFIGPTERPYVFAAPGRDRDGPDGAPLVRRAHEALLPFQVRKRVGAGTGGWGRLESAGKWRWSCRATVYAVGEARPSPRVGGRYDGVVCVTGTELRTDFMPPPLRDLAHTASTLRPVALCGLPVPAPMCGTG